MAEPVKIGTRIKVFVDGREALATVTHVNSPAMGACRLEFQVGGENDAVTVNASEVEKARDSGEPLIV